jgi:poly-gamma-glutamate synthesis protein (capsule biosynthesis protein)
MKRLAVLVLCAAAVACAPIARKEAAAPAPETAASEIRISAVGDIMLDASARATMDARGYDYPFEDVREVFANSHVVIGNLEGPLAYGGVPEPDKQFLFRSPPDRVAPALKRAGFSVLNLANNHTLDYGADGLAETLAALQGADIAYSGAGLNLDEARRAAIVTVNGMRVAFLGYSLTFPETFYAKPQKAGTAYGHAEQVRTDIAEARRHADAVIASFHWGQEGNTGLREYQLALAHAAIDAGAVAVLGHHPHVLQAVERYRDGVICYSLGNFAFGSFSPRATRAAIARLTLRNGHLSEVRLIPLNVNNFEVYFQPQLLAGSEADEVVSTLQELSAARGTTIRNDAGVGVISFE